MYHLDRHILPALGSTPLCDLEKFRCQMFLNKLAEQNFSFTVVDHCRTMLKAILEETEYKGKVGDAILIRAVDDIGLAEVDVTLTRSDGTNIETGKAVEQGVRSGHWTYTATTPVPLGNDIFIEVVGVDHAGT